MDTSAEGFARSLLERLGLPAEPLRPASGWSNQVWLAPRHVVRLSSGRFRDAYVHEVRVLGMLPDEVPYARAVGHGRINDREWLVLERVPGEALLRAWPEMTSVGRREALRSLGRAIRALHSVELPPGFYNPWLEDAYSPGGEIRNAYHAPPALYPRLLETAERVPGTDPGVLAELGSFIEDRLSAFGDGREVLVHGDLHFGNLLWGGSCLTALLDFEGSRPGPADVELDTLLRFAREPGQYRASDGDPLLSPSDLSGVLSWLTEGYPELCSHPRLRERLEVYEATWHLVQLQHFPPGSGGPDPWGHILALLSGSFRPLP